MERLVIFVLSNTFVLWRQTRLRIRFKPNSKFEDAVALYNFDIELRDLMFKAVQRLVIALRTKIIQEFSLAHGPFWFFDTSLADDEHKFIENMNSIDRELQRSKEDFIKEHRRNYDKPIFPPAWKTLELAPFFEEADFMVFPIFSGFFNNRSRLNYPDDN